MSPVDRHSVSGHDLVITEYFDAPRDLVFRNWIDAELVRAWFAPDGFSVTHCELDARPGGRWRVTFGSGADESHTESGEFYEVVAPEKLVFSLTQQNSRGESGAGTMVTVTFAQVGAQTRMDFRQSGYDDVRTRDGNAEGWGECLRKLAASLLAQARAGQGS